MGASYDPVKDFAPIITIATGPQMLVAGPSLNVDNLEQLITLARQHPDRITYAAGVGLTMTGLAGVLLNSMADIKLAAHSLSRQRTGSRRPACGARRSPVRAGACGQVSCREGRVEGARDDVGDTRQRRAGCADHGGGRCAGIRAQPVVWAGRSGGNAREAIDMLSRIANDALKSEDVMKPLRAQGIDPVGGTPEQFARFIERETEKMARMARLGGLTK